MDNASKYTMVRLLATGAILGVATVMGTYTLAYAVTFTTGCSGNSHDSGPHGNPHDSGDHGNPHDVNNLEPTDEAGVTGTCPGSK